MLLKLSCHCKHACILKLLFCFNFSAQNSPEITQHPINRTVVRNEPVTLDCLASGSPIPTITWFKDGLPLTMDRSSHRILLPDGSLFFLRAMQNRKEQDGGVYWCVAENEHGEARSKNATLDIACKFIHTHQKYSIYIPLNMVVSCSKNCRPKFYRVIFFYIFTSPLCSGSAVMPESDTQ